VHPIALLGAALPAVLTFGWILVAPSMVPPTASALLIALATAVPLALWIRNHATLLLLGYALSAVAVASVLRVDVSLAGASPWSTAPPWTFVDLTEGALPDPPPRWLSARGYLHTATTLGEYDVPAGEHPDQSRPPVATLVPLLPKPEASALDPSAHVVIARVAELPTEAQDPLVLRGQTRPLPRDLLTTLVEVPADLPVHGVLLDTLSIPRPRDAWLALLAALLAIALAAICYTLARRP